MLFVVTRDGANCVGTVDDAVNTGNSLYSKNLFKIKATLTIIITNMTKNLNLIFL